jgi:hypothetical protein
LQNLQGFVGRIRVENPGYVDRGAALCQESSAGGVFVRWEMAEEKCGYAPLARRLFVAGVDGGLPMSEYPELKEFIEGFAARYTRRTERGPELSLTDEEFRTLAEFLTQGLVEWAEAAKLSDALDHPALGNFLEEFADRRSRGSDVGAAVEVGEEDMLGLGLFLTKGLIGWVLKLDRNRGRFERFDEIVGGKRPSFSGAFSRRLLVGAW